MSVAALMVAFGLSSCASKPKAAGPSNPVVGEAPQEPSERTGAEPSGVRPGSQEDLAANVGDRVFFEFDSYTLPQVARATLSRQAAWLARYPDVRVIIAGNADERGTREYNIALAARRADAARQFLVTQGVASSRMKTVSYGKEQPLAPDSNEEAWARNRNAQTVVVDAVGRW
jgi:peptidoglycan-associated lipoprotein